MGNWTLTLPEFVFLSLLVGVPLGVAAAVLRRRG